MNTVELFDPATHDYSVPNITTFVAVLLNQNELSVAMYDPTNTAADTYHFSETFLGKIFSKVGALLAGLLSPFGLALSPLLATILGGLLTVGGPIAAFLIAMKLLPKGGGRGRASAKTAVDINVYGGHPQ